MKRRHSKTIWKGLVFAMLWTVSLGMFAQNVTVRGTVTDDADEPVIGATIIVEGNATVGTVTDMDGNYVLNNVPSNGNLVFSYVGMKPQTVAINGRTTIDVVMASDTELLDEVVVVGYAIQKKVNVTGAVSSIDSKTLESRPVQNVSQMLQGVVPGLNFSTTNSGGALNSRMNVNIRGGGTIGDGSSGGPLILIDGSQGDMNALNPNDIENISVLKDAAASSIYGSRAAFGVILITTKSGKSGAPRVNYTGNMRFSTATQIPEMMDAYQFAQYFNAANANNGGGAIFGKTLMERIQANMEWQKTGKGTKPVTTHWNAAKQEWDLYYEGDGASDNTDWFGEMYMKNAPSHEHNLSVSGGSDKMTYYVSGNFLNQRGLIRHGKDEFQRYTLSGKITADLSDKVKLVYNNKWIREDYTRPSYMTGLFFHNIARRWPVNPVKDPNGHYVYGNEITQMRGGGVDNNQKDLLYQQATLTYTPIKNWNINLEGNYNVTNENNHWDKLPVYHHNDKGEPILSDWSGGDKGQSVVYEGAKKWNYFSGKLYSNYSFDINDHNINLLGGMDMELEKIRNIGGSKKDLVSPLVPTLNTATDDKPILGGGYQHWSTMGFFGRVNYNYMEKYLFEANIRRDGTSRFIGDKTWGTFPSFSAGWNIARENFFGDLANNISTLKLRASWGQLGNTNTNALYPFFLGMPFSSGAGNWLVNGERTNLSGAPGIVSSLMTWERVESWDLGLDWNALNGRFTGTFDYFKRITKDMIGPAPELSSLLGTGVPKINNADLETYGWELEIGWRDRINDFSYGAKLALSDDRTKVTRYPNESMNINDWYAGKMSGDIWGYTTVGIAKTDAEMTAHIDKNKPSWGTNWTAGDVMYADLTGDGAVNSGKETLDDHGDLKIIGNNTPRYKFGLNLDAQWKGIDFSIFFQGVGKRDWWFGGTPYFWGATADGMWQSAGFKEHWNFWRPEGDALGANLDAYYPKPRFEGGGKNTPAQTRYLQNAAYLRIKNAQLGYTLPSAWMQNLGLSSVRIYTTVDNLVTFTKITRIFDPEALGGDWGPGKLYPLQRTWAVGVNINF